MTRISSALFLVVLSSLLLAGEPPDDLGKARDAVVHGRYDEALTALDALLAKPEEKTEREARALRVQAYEETGRYKEALAEAEALCKLAPETADALVLHASVLMETGHYGEAGKRLAKALDLDKGHLKARLLTLELARLTGDHDACEAQVGHFLNLYSQGQAKSAEALTTVARAVQEEDAQGSWRAYQEAQKADPNYVDALVLGGFHCLEKYSWQFARQCFEKALKLNPNLAIAHAGLAAAQLANNRYDEAVKAIEAAQKTNPNLRIAHLMRASMLAVEEKHDESLAEVRKALDVNPNDPEALSMLAAHYEAVGNTAERDKTLARALQINPKCAEGYATLALASERLRRCPAAIGWARKAIELDPDYWRGYYLAGMNLLRAGEEDEGYKLLDRAFSLNGFNIWAYNTLTVVDRDLKKKEFVYHETPHFFVKLDKTEDAILWPYAETILEPMYDRLTKKYAVEPVGPKQYGGRTLVLMYPKHEEFSGRTVGLPGLSALGACLGQVITMPSPRLSHLRPDNAFNWRDVLIHEFTHVLTLQKTRYNIPRWFTEGLSVWEEDDTRVQWDAMLFNAVANNELLPLEDLNSGFTRPKTPTQVPVCYYVGMLICRHFDQAYGFDAMRKMLDLYRDGAKTPDVLPKVTGRKMADLNKEVTDYVRRYTEQIKLSPQIGKEETEKLEKEAKKDAKNADLWTRIAAGRLGQGKLDEAREAAKKAAELDPKLARAHGILGLIALQKDKDEAEARKHFLAAKEADPNYFFARYQLGLAAEKDNDTKTAIAELGASKAIYPRFRQGSQSLQEHLADLYVKTGKRQKAIEVLREVTDLHSSNHRALIRLAGLLADEGKHAEAAASYLEAIYIDPFEPETHLAAARAYEAADALDPALREYSVAAAIEPANLAKLVDRARAFAVAGRPDDARKAVAAIRKLDPNSAEAAKIEKLLPK